ncbi:MAG: dockerin [Polyangiaceae bacterium]
MTRARWDWVGIIGTGQSLSVGAPPLLSTEQPYGNLKLSLGGHGNGTVPPWDPSLRELAMVPLVEPIRELARGYPAPYPGNVYGETPHTAMSIQISALARAAFGEDYVTVHSVVGESGQGIEALKKRQRETTGITGRAYAASLFEVLAIRRLAAAAGKSYGIGALVLTHGETDARYLHYEAELLQLYADYNADLGAVTGQSEPVPFFVSQQHGLPSDIALPGQRPLVNRTQWQLANERPEQFVCTGPKYQYQGDPSGDGVHLAAAGYRAHGEKVGQVYFERQVLGNAWRPLQPTGVTVDGRRLLVRFHVPVAPLVWDESFDAPALPEWRHGRGFELSVGEGAGEQRLAIESVAIVGDTVVVTANDELPTRGVTLGYALSNQGVRLSNHSNAARWGMLRDSDPFVGAVSGEPNPNYAVSFELRVN